MAMNEMMLAENMPSMADVDINLTRNDAACYSSLKTGTLEEKAIYYNAISDPEFRIADKVGEIINVKDIYIELIDMTNDETGEVNKAPRVILIDTDGHSYSCVSMGIFNSLRRLVQVFGAPTWEQGLAVKVKQIAVNKNRVFTLTMA